MLVKNITSGRLHVELVNGESISLNAGETIDSEKVFALDRLLEIHFLAEVKEEKKEEPKKVKVSDAVKPPKAAK